jgi:hypothetical protein
VAGLHGPGLRNLESKPEEDRETGPGRAKTAPGLRRSGPGLSIKSPKVCRQDRKGLSPTGSWLPDIISLGLIYARNLLSSLIVSLNRAGGFRDASRYQEGN